MKTNTTSINELRGFVTNQALEDAGLSPSERQYQEELVADVLGQEAPNKRVHLELLELYRSGRQTA